MSEFCSMNIFMAEKPPPPPVNWTRCSTHRPVKHARNWRRVPSAPNRPSSPPAAPPPASKIVVQAIVRPGDIVLVDRDCHKSHHYGMVLAGHQRGLSRQLSAQQILDVRRRAAAREIKHQLLTLKKKAGKLDRVRMLLLTNCTFDGIIPTSRGSWKVPDQKPLTWCSAMGQAGLPSPDSPTLPTAHRPWLPPHCCARAIAIRPMPSATLQQTGNWPGASDKQLLETRFAARSGQGAGAPTPP